MKFFSTFLSLAATLLILGVSIQKAEAQDPRYSQFYAAPLELNPAMIGVFDGKYRIVANYRELYSSILGSNPYRTFAASYDMRFRALKGDYVGFGISAQRDEAGQANFNRTTANLGFSYLKQLGGGRYGGNDQYLIAGGQLGLGQHGYDWSRLWFSPQFNEEFAFIDPTVDNGENFTAMNSDMYLNFNAGLLWYALFEDNMSIYFGGAYHHLNSPNVSFLQNADEVLHSRWVFNAGGEIPFSDNLSFLPAIAVMGQNKSMSTTLGGNFRYTNRDWREVAIRAGIWGHISNQLESGMAMDAVIFTAILEMERLNIGLSYDMTASTLSTANNARGAFEVSLIYTQPEKARRPRATCPKF